MVGDRDMMLRVRHQRFASVKSMLEEQCIDNGQRE